MWYVKTAKIIARGKKMKKISVFMFCTILVLSGFISCSGTSDSPDFRAVSYDSYDGVTTFSDITNKEWALTEVKTALNTVQINRSRLQGDFFTIRFYGGDFNRDTVSGIAAPNLYSGVYTTGRGGVLSIGNLLSTLMAPIDGPEGFSEFEYMSYLYNVTHWNLSEGNLKLFSVTSDGAEAVLFFTLN